MATRTIRVTTVSNTKDIMSVYFLKNIILVVSNMNSLKYYVILDFMEADQFPLNELKEKEERKRRRKRGIFDDEEDSEEDFSHSRKKRQAPYLIFPEILCIIDYDGYR